MCNCASERPPSVLKPLTDVTCGKDSSQWLSDKSVFFYSHQESIRKDVPNPLEKQ